MSIVHLLSRTDARVGVVGTLSGQAEILRYLNFVADRFDLKRDIRFDTRVVAAAYDEQANRWQVRTEGGEPMLSNS